MANIEKRQVIEVIFKQPDKSHILPLIGYRIGPGLEVRELCSSVDNPGVRIVFFPVAIAEANAQLESRGINSIALVN